MGMGDIRWEKKRENRKHDADLRNEPLYLFNKFYACERILFSMVQDVRTGIVIVAVVACEKCMFIFILQKNVRAKWNLHKKYKKIY